MEPLYIREDLRIRDLDDLQWVLEKRTVAKKGKNVGSYQWGRVAYCTTAKGLSMAVQDWLRCEHVEQARQVAAAEWKHSGIHENILSSIKDK